MFQFQTSFDYKLAHTSHAFHISTSFFYTINFKMHTAQYKGMNRRDKLRFLLLIILGIFIYFMFHMQTIDYIHLLCSYPWLSSYCPSLPQNDGQFRAHFKVQIFIKCLFKSYRFYVKFIQGFQKANII